MRRVLIKSWAKQGEHQVDFPFLENPWEPFPIEIIGMEASLLNDKGAHSMFTCNNYRPDIFFMAGEGETRCAGMFQDDLMLPFPAAGGENSPHLDIHIEFAGFPYFFAYTVFYLGGV